ncbi:S-layer homology domain-containing protein [Ructibacterium gallinarum]|uniref:S-layer homology domain-containing protein n=1 Tax=Ructibacterium gallinarum TaxID=2779355 RepID=A0A9D5M3Y3_9FIRM|nr:S-layer homology domain-containing protein [Ructibacterium gallinarum]MBE5039109.1 S-layer homology domain-containing protein [Ructibacterium gallinarum]
MRNTKRFLSLVLAVAMIATCIFTAAYAEDTTATTTTTGTTSFTDVADTASYATAVKTLSLMSILNGYPDGTFRPDQNVTRAEFTAMLMRTLNYGSVGSTSASGLPFSDVDDNNTDINWAIPNINTAYSMGIINGYEDGTFRPSDNVAYEEAVKMIVCTLGYTDIDVSGTPWYGQYLSQANKLGITKYASSLGQAETPASRSCIAQMLYDSLEVRIIEQDTLTEKTILTDYLGYIKNVGTIASDGVTSMTSPDVNLRDDEIQIYAKEPDSGNYETYTYRTTDTSLKQYLGYEIEYYYKNDGGSIRTLGLYVLRDNRDLEITSDMVEYDTTTATQIRYYKTDADKTSTQLTLDNQNVVIYNGKLYGRDAASSRFNPSMIPTVGTITLLDSNGDGKYDLLNIKDYEIYYVSTKVSAEYSIVDDVTRTGEDKSLVLDVDNGSIPTTIVNTSGATVSYSSIGTGNIICLARSNAGNGGEVIQTAVVVTDSVSGTVNGVDAESMTINGKKYKFSQGAPWMEGGSGTLEMPVVQDSGTYCLDINGDVVAYKKDAVTENVSYGYIMGYAESSDSFDDTITLRILNQNGQEEYLVVTKSTRVNGKDMGSVNGVLDALMDTANLQNTDPENSNVDVQQVVKYTTKNSSSGRAVDKIITVTDDTITNSGKETTVDTLYYFTPAASGSMTYTSSSKQLKGTGVNINIGSSIIFVVPSDRDSFDDYAKNSLAVTFKNNQEYYVEVYDVSNTNSAKIVVCYGGNASGEVDSSSPVNVVTDVRSESNPANNNQNMLYVEGYSSSYSTPKGTLESWISNESDLSPVKGDIFRAGTDKEGDMKYMSEDLIYRLGDDNRYGTFIEPAGESFDDAEYAVILGSVIATDETSFTIRDERVGKGDVIDNPNDAQIFNFSEFSGARVLRYDNSGAELQITDLSSEYEGALKGLTTYQEGATNPSKVLLYMSQGRVRLLCILDKDE